VVNISKAKLRIADKRTLFFDCGGHCSICRIALYYDSFSRTSVESQEYAHIIGDSEDGPRGCKKSGFYAGDINNIIVLCPSCHTIVDKNVLYYTVERLRSQKSNHEKQVKILLDSLKNEKASTVKYTAPIGEILTKIDEAKMDDAIRESGFVSFDFPVDLNPNNTVLRDYTPDFWHSEWIQLKENFNKEIVTRQKRDELFPVLLFALAPQPLLIRLGILFNDLWDVRAFQKRRDPDTWRWEDESPDQSYVILQPDKKYNTVAVKMSLSDDITNERIHEILGEQVSIWTITHETPKLDYLYHPSQLEKLRIAFREFFQKVRDYHGLNTVLHVFPAAPNSAAIEFGRTWMPKVDAKLVLYDHVRHSDKFVLAYDLS